MCIDKYIFSNSDFLRNIMFYSLREYILKSHTGYILCTPFINLLEIAFKSLKLQFLSAFLI